MSWLKAALGYVATAYLSDTFVKPRQLGKLARQHCDQVHKPLLLIHDAGVAHHVFGAPIKAEASRRTAYPVRVPDRTFGAVLAVGVLECLRKPDRALAEWRRVADRVFVVVPSWYSPHAWLNPSHRWFIDPSLSRALPLWNSRRGIYLLQVSDKRYGDRRWNPPSPTPTPMTPNPASRPSPSATGTQLTTPTFPGQSLPSPRPSPPTSPSTSSPSPYGDMPDLSAMALVSGNGLPDISEVSLGSDPRPSEPSASSRSVTDLVVISSRSSDES